MSAREFQLLSAEYASIQISSSNAAELIDFILFIFTVERFLIGAPDR